MAKDVSANVSKPHRGLSRLILILLLVMAHVVRMMFYGFRAPDVWLLIVELLVLGLILYDVLSGVLHKRKMAKRLSELFPLLERGQRLQTSIPVGPSSVSLPDFEATQRWMSDFKAWNSETETFLSRKSSKAASIFRHVINAARTDRAMWGRSGEVHYLSGEIGNTYQLLQVKLDNLHRIIGNPDAYF